MRRDRVGVTESHSVRSGRVTVHDKHLRESTRVARKRTGRQEDSKRIEVGSKPKTEYAAWWNTVVAYRENLLLSMRVAASCCYGPSGRMQQDSK